MSVTELNISPVGRVEGDLDVKVYIENGKVTRAHTQAAMFRGFEKIMEGHTCIVRHLRWIRHGEQN